jgi:hypothetical protein
MREREPTHVKNLGNKFSECCDQATGITRKPRLSTVAR